MHHKVLPQVDVGTNATFNTNAVDGTAFIIHLTCLLLTSCSRQAAQANAVAHCLPYKQAPHRHLACHVTSSSTHHWDKNNPGQTGSDNAAAISQPPLTPHCWLPAITAEKGAHVQAIARLCTLAADTPSGAGSPPSNNARMHRPKAVDIPSWYQTSPGKHRCMQLSLTRKIGTATHDMNR